jgi:hypothetical protein
VGHAVVVRNGQRRLRVIEMFFVYDWRRGVLQPKLRGVLWDRKLYFACKLGSHIFRLDISDTWLKIWRSLNTITQKSLVTSKWIEVISKLGLVLWRRK